MKYTFILQKIIPATIEEHLCITLVSNVFFMSRLSVSEFRSPNCYVRWKCTDGCSGMDTSSEGVPKHRTTTESSARTLPICHWDHHPFNHEPFMIPIQPLHPRSNYTITKSNSYTIPVYMSSIEDKKTSPLIFIAEGTFCSLSCALAYVLDHPHEPIFHESVSLLYYIASRYYGISRLHPSLSWKLLDTYGGNETITTFRNKVCPTLVDATGYDMPLYMCLKHNMYKL